MSDFVGGGGRFWGPPSLNIEEAARRRGGAEKIQKFL